MEELEIKTLDLEQCWLVFKTEIEMETEEYRDVRFGVDIKFDINDYLLGNMKIVAKTGIIYYKGRNFNTESFYTELEKRERIMKRWLEIHLLEERDTSPRTQYKKEMELIKNGQ